MAQSWPVLHPRAIVRCFRCGYVHNKLAHEHALSGYAPGSGAHVTPTCPHCEGKTWFDVQPTPAAPVPSVAP